MKTLNRQQISDILYGCAILGTGGGGELAEGFEFIEKALAAGKEFKLVDIDQLDDDKMLCTPYMLGALAIEQDDTYQGLPQSKQPPIMTAFKRLQEYTGAQFHGTICCELGGSNTAISFYLAAMIDGVIVDADPAGRAVPEITHSTYYLNNLPAAPIITANEFGECFICENVIDDQRAESIVRALAMVSRNDIAAIDHALPVSIMKHAVIKGTISKALAIGEAYRYAKEQNIDIATRVAEFGKGIVRFRGVVTNFEFSTIEGFTIGSFNIAGEGEFAGRQYRVNVKNENLSATLDGKIDVTIPDLICCLDMDKLEPVTNPNFVNGMNVAIVILPAPKEFTTEKGLNVFGPKYLGLQTDYNPAI
ncbi:DUF917 domain-containing protein [Psychrosphaera sp. B3R10]|uniref:DUF917 domain-containing protein n=1 Tax=unclassified Psychrosphaera TaxID=2641570 RepID=UPI001C08A1FD|nr:MULTISPECIES: DUF917 domain-containing protein [unclassified Psychrosphaera]MBU2883466.1 DUF917 domain-containing protein [Psychrosphaera sp. I2R16]MBU2990322.1 DUF917 domain-containing protein [Psychrosphaera sp. B3R10]